MRNSRGMKPHEMAPNRPETDLKNKKTKRQTNRPFHGFFQLLT